LRNSNKNLIAICSDLLVADYPRNLIDTYLKGVNSKCMSYRTYLRLALKLQEYKVIELHKTSYGRGKGKYWILIKVNTKRLEEVMKKTLGKKSEEKRTNN
jgi:hypothetical protein